MSPVTCRVCMAHSYKKRKLCPKNLCHERGSPQNFRPTSVQFKARINGEKARKRHQTPHLEFYIPRLLTEGLLVFRIAGGDKRDTP